MPYGRLPDSGTLERELVRDSVVAKNTTVQTEGGRRITYEIEYFILYAIISVGYWVNSIKGMQFRLWATQRLRPVKGSPIRRGLKQKSPVPGKAQGWYWWRRRDSWFHIFRYGLDYSFTCRCRQGRACCGRLPLASIHPSTPWRQVSLGAYESLAGLRVSPSPDGVGVGPLSLSVHRMSSLFPTGISPRGDHCVNRTRVRKSSAIGSTCLSTSIDLTARYPMGRENTRRFRKDLAVRPRTCVPAIL